METDLKQYYCEKYKAMCLKDKCSEGIEIVDHKSWCDDVQCYSYDGTEHYIHGYRSLEMITIDGKTLYGFDHPVNFVGKGCEEIQHKIELKRLQLKEEAENKRSEEEARQKELEESKKKYYLYTVISPAIKGFITETNVTKSLCKADVIIQLINEGYHILFIDKISKKDGVKIEAEYKDKGYPKYEVSFSD